MFNYWSYVMTTWWYRTLFAPSTTTSLSSTYICYALFLLLMGESKELESNSLVRANYLHLELKKYSFLLCQVCSIPFNTWVGRQHASNLNLAGKLAGVVFQFRCIHTRHVNFWFCKALPDYSKMIDNNSTGFIWSFLGSTWTAFMLVTLILE